MAAGSGTDAAKYMGGKWYSWFWFKHGVLVTFKSLVTPRSLILVSPANEKSRTAQHGFADLLITTNLTRAPKVAGLVSLTDPDEK